MSTDKSSLRRQEGQSFLLKKLINFNHEHGQAFLLIKPYYCDEVGENRGGGGDDWGDAAANHWLLHLVPSPPPRVHSTGTISLKCVRGRYKGLVKIPAQPKYCKCVLKFPLKKKRNDKQINKLSFLGVIKFVVRP